MCAWESGQKWVKICRPTDYVLGKIGNKSVTKRVFEL